MQQIRIKYNLPYSVWSFLRKDIYHPYSYKRVCTQISYRQRILHNGERTYSCSIARKRSRNLGAWNF